MKKNKNSLDLLEEQLFNLLKEYQGFSNGAQYVGMNTKDPYEDRDVQWNKKVYGRDTKNIKVLIGSGDKKSKHVKSGDPYTNNPPKRRPVNKLSAPPGILQEEENPDNFNKTFQEVTSGEIGLYVKKDITYRNNGAAESTIFKAGNYYSGEVVGDSIEIQHENFKKSAVDVEIPSGSNVFTKEELLDSLYGDLCVLLDCVRSFIMINGVQETFLMIMNRRPDVKQKKSDSLSSSHSRNIANNGVVVGAVVEDVLNGSNPAEAITNKIGYHPKTQAFADGFYKIAQQAIDQLPNKDEKQAAALVSVLFETIAIIPVDVTVRLYSLIPDGAFDAAKAALGSLVAQIPFIQELTKLYEDITKQINTAADFIKRTQRMGQLGVQDITNLKDSDGKADTAVLLSTSNVIDPFKVFAQNKKFNDFKTFIANGIDEFNNIIPFFSANKDKIGLIFLNISDKVGVDDTASLASKIRDILLDAQIVVIG